MGISDERAKPLGSRKPWRPGCPQQLLPTRDDEHAEEAADLLELPQVVAELGSGVALVIAGIDQQVSLKPTARSC